MSPFFYRRFHFLTYPLYACEEKNGDFCSKIERSKVYH